MDPSAPYSRHGDGLGPAPERVRRILVIRPGGLGDVVHAVPALRHLRTTYPDAELRVATSAPARELLDACPYVDRSIDLARPGAMLREPVDIVISFARPGDAARVEVDDVDAVCRLAWSSADCEPHVQGRPAWPDRLDDTARMLRLAWLLGGGRADHALGLWPTLADRNGAARLVARNERPIALLHVGGSTAARRWSRDHWVRVAQLVDAMGLDPVLVGGMEDRSRSASVTQEARVDVTDLTGCSSVGELAGLLERATLFVGGDSGPASLAIALGTRSVVVAPRSPFEHAGRPGVVDLVDAGPCPECGERACAHEPPPAGQVPLDAVLATVSLAAGRALERWHATRID